MHLGQEVYGTTLGIIGFGRIGRAVAERAQGFAMRVLTATARQGLSDALKNVLREADFVSVHCPLTPETHHLIDAEALELMGPNSILINTARGPIVDPRAPGGRSKKGRHRRCRPRRHRARTAPRGRSPPQPPRT